MIPVFPGPYLRTYLRSERSIWECLVTPELERTFLKAALNSYQYKTDLLLSSVKPVMRKPDSGKEKRDFYSLLGPESI